MANQNALEVISIHCVCGVELGKVSANVLGLSTHIKCKECGRNNEFNHSLRPERDTHQMPSVSPSIGSQAVDIRGQKL
jgi:hypothetical protein